MLKDLLNNLFGGADKSDNQSPKQPSAVCRAIAEYLDCKYDYIPAGIKPADIEKLEEIFNAAVEEGKEQGYIPVLIAANDVNLAEMFYDNAHLSLSLKGDCKLTDADKAALREYRAQLIAELGENDAENFLNERIEESTEYDDDEFDLDEMYGGDEIFFEDIRSTFSAPFYPLFNDTHEMLLAKIPVTEPWQIAAWLPMGGWNECPPPEDMLAIAKRWYDKYGAVICCMSADELEFRVSNPPTDSDEAYELAKEQYYFCQDRIEQYTAEYNLKTLANGLMKSSIWYFWWD